jgi:prevent-host-death family protein
MSRRTIAQRELRNDVTRILREAEAGTEFTVTVRGRPVARLGPPDDGRPARRVDVDGRALRALLAATPVDASFARDVTELREAEEPADDPWDDG